MTSRNEYIENELKKKRLVAHQGGGEEDKVLEIAPTTQDLLLKFISNEALIINENSNFQAKDQESFELDATAPGVLVQIPEVDLGIDTKMQNIQKTQQAKKKFENSALTDLSSILKEPAVVQRCEFLLCDSSLVDLGNHFNRKEKDKASG